MEEIKNDGRLIGIMGSIEDFPKGLGFYGTKEDFIQIGKKPRNINNAEKGHGRTQKRLLPVLPVKIKREERKAGNGEDHRLRGKINGKGQKPPEKKPQGPVDHDSLALRHAQVFIQGRQDKDLNDAEEDPRGGEKNRRHAERDKNRRNDEPTDEHTTDHTKSRSKIDVPDCWAKCCSQNNCDHNHQN